VFAVLHGLALFGLATVALPSEWGTRLWIAFATFWFFWPIVLALHPGQVVWKVVSLTTIVLLMLPLFRLYDLSASSVFGWPEGFSLTPWRAASWTNAYLSGRVEAIKDIKHGHLVIEECGFGAGIGHRVQILHDRYGIELKPTAQCIVNSRILGHECGYNSISKPEIARRYGPNAIQAAFEEGWKLDREDAARLDQRAKDLARTVSSIPAGRKVTLESLFLYDNQGPTEIELRTSEMINVTDVIHWIEALISSAVPDDAPAFESNISAELTSSARPKLEISSSASAPREVHMQVYDKLDNVPDVRSQRERILIAMRFQVRSLR
jgi:hypothetical protein